jgi:hypothetical protein
MTKVGRWVTDPKAGAYWILINHDKGGFKGGWIIIDRVKYFGFRSERVFACNLDSEEGKTALAEPRSPDATPLGAFVKFRKSATSVVEVKARCKSLMTIHRESGR